jgi:hypothetical protein
MSKYEPFESNFFKTPNQLIDEYMKDLPPIAFKCLMVVLRKTEGWSKYEDDISLSQFIKYTGASKNSVLTALNTLQQEGHISIEKTTIQTENGTLKMCNKYQLGILKDDSSAKIELGGSAKIELGGSAKIAHTKDNSLNTSFKNKYTTSKEVVRKSKENSSCSEKDKEFQKLLSFWNKQENISHHKPGTKTVADAYKYFCMLRAGTFPAIAADIAAKNKIDKSLCKHKFTTEEIIKGIKNYLLQFEPGYWPFEPEQKKSLSKRLPDVLYNSRLACVSPFLKCYSNKPARQGETVIKNKYAQTGFELMKEFFENQIFHAELDKSQTNELRTSILAIKRKHDSITETPGTDYKVFEKDTHFTHVVGYDESKFEMFINKYLFFLEGESKRLADWFAEEGIKSDVIPLSSIKPGNAKWNRFKKFCIQKWNIYLEPTKQDWKQIEFGKQKYLTFLEDLEFAKQPKEMTEEDEQHFIDMYL